MPYVEFPLDGLLNNLQNTLELFVLDPTGYGSSIVTTLTNFVEILLKGFLISNQITQLPQSLSGSKKQERIRQINNLYKGRYLHEMSREISSLAIFNSKQQFLDICKFYRRTKDDYRNEYTHEFFSYKMDIPFHITQDIVAKFLDYISILAQNWPELKAKLDGRSKLLCLIYYIQFEVKNPGARWRAFNRDINRKISEKFSEYLGEDFEAVKKLIIIYELGIGDDQRFCSEILGYDPQARETVISILKKSDQLTERQIRNKFQERGLDIRLLDLEKVLEDLTDQGMVQKRYEERKILFSLVT